MSRFHTKTVAQKPSREALESHLNWMGGQSFDVKNPLKALRMAASSCFFGEPQYYHTDAGDTRARRSGAVHASPLASTDLTYLRETLHAADPQEWRGLTPAALMESAIDKALDFDPEATLLEAVRLRTEEHMRTTPQVILVRAAHHPKVRGTGLLKKYSQGILQRADEPAVGLAYHVWRYVKSITKEEAKTLEGKGVELRDGAYVQVLPIPNALKKAWKTALEGYSEYALSKYKMDSKGVKTVDVVNLVHPKSDAVNKLVRGELKLSNETWEAIISKGGSTKENWIKALDAMGHMALLRNLRNLLEKGVDQSAFVKTLVEGAEKGKQFPFRYYSAYKAVGAAAPGPVRDALEDCIMKSVKNLPHFPGRMMSLCDNSGSAHGTMTSAMGSMSVAEIANLTGVLAGLCADDGYVGIFGDSLEVMPVRKKASIFDQTKTLGDLGSGIGGGTENGIWMFWDKAIRTKEHWDTVFVFSDMQAGHGGLYGLNPAEYCNFLWNSGRNIDVAKLITTYRAQVNANVKVFLVQMAGYQDTILPEFYQNTYILGGWGEGLLRFAAEMSKLGNPSQA